MNKYLNLTDKLYNEIEDVLFERGMLDEVLSNITKKDCAFLVVVIENITHMMFEFRRNTKDEVTDIVGCLPFAGIPPKEAEEIINGARYEGDVVVVSL